MRKLTYSMGVSLDGYIAGPDGAIAFSAPDEELHRFHNDRARELDMQLYGRRMYQTMRPWAEDQPSYTDVMREFAEIWRATPLVVFSTTLPEVEGNARLVREGAVEEVARLKAQPGRDLAVGGAGLAATVIDLIDEFGLFVNPVVLGGGTPFFPPAGARIDLELVETRTFGSRVVYLRYRRRSVRS